MSDSLTEDQLITHPSFENYFRLLFNIFFCFLTFADSFSMELQKQQTRNPPQTSSYNQFVGLWKSCQTELVRCRDWADEYHPRH